MSQKETTVIEDILKHEPIRWSDDSLVMFLDGWAWTCLKIDGEVKHISLGKEDDVKAMLAGAKPITEAKEDIQTLALARILEIREEQDAKPASTRATSVERSRSPRVVGYRAKNPRLFKTRKRASSNTAHEVFKSLSG